MQKRSTVCILVVLAMLAISTCHQVQAAPYVRDYPSDQMYVNLAIEEPLADDAAVQYQRLAKRPDLPTISHVVPTTTETKPPTATTSHAATSTTSSKPPAATTKASDTTKAGAATTSSRGTATPSGSGTAANPTITSGGATAGPTADGGSVPINVSQKVLIGLGTVGGLIVLSLGGVAFVRQRRKKTLATTLLKQTAQFNNNNPYAKLPEPAVAAAGNMTQTDMAMTPTKPLGTFKVVATYTPALADEIEIGLGDSVTILQEYDDGWCMGVNNTRNAIKGVFPRHCVENNYDGSQHGGSQHGGGPNSPKALGPPGGFGSPKQQFMANKRMSSIAPQGQGWNQGYNNGPNGGFGPNYPPQPSPMYNGPNSGPIGPPQHQGGGGGGYY